MYVSSAKFTENNDARPTYFCAGLAALLILTDQVVRRTSSIQTRSIYCLAAFMFLIAAVMGMNSLLGCIWHPIPKSRRGDGELTTLHLNNSTDDEAPIASSQMFASLEDEVANGDEELIGASQIEMRDKIQWGKLSLITMCIGFDILLLTLFSH
jgi:hypothetical protein